MNPVDPNVPVITGARTLGSVLTATLPADRVATMQFTRTSSAGVKTPIASAVGTAVNTLTYKPSPADLPYDIGCDAWGHVISAQTVHMVLPVIDWNNPDFALLLGSETWTTPTQDFGPVLSVAGTHFTKAVATSGADNLFGYHVAAVTTISSGNISTAGLSNATTAESQVGTITAPGDSLIRSKDSILNITVTADSVLPSCMLSMNFSTTRLGNGSYRVKKHFATDGVSKTFTLALKLNAYAAGSLQMASVDAGTAPTTLPGAAGIVDTNLAANVEWPIYFSFDGAAAPATCHITGIAATLTINPPVADTSTGPYRDPTLQPFNEHDHWNLPLYDNAVLSKQIITGSPTSTGDQSTGTLNASGTAGSNVVQVYSTAGLKPGMVPCVGGFSPSTSVYGLKSTGGVDNLATATAFGYGNYIDAVVDATHVQMHNPLVGNLNLRGIYYYNYIPCLCFMAAETASMQTAANGGQYSQPGAITGLNKATNYSAPPIASKIPVLRCLNSSATQNFVTSMNSPNAWLHAQPSQYANASTYGEAFANVPYTMKAPAALMDPTAVPIGSYNGDGNLVIITENGDEAIETIGTGQQSDKSFSSYRGVTAYLRGASNPYFLNRPENRISGYTQGTRAWGGPLIGGVVRAQEFSAIPSSANTAETPQQIAAAIAQCKTAIPHRLAMIMSANQIKSPNYAADPTNQSALTNYFMYVSQCEVHTPAIKTVGAGHVPGELLTIVGGVCTSPMRAKVETVDANGGVTKVFVTSTGQYKAITGMDASALATTSSGAGTGCVLNCLALADTAITSTALAFPSADQTPIYTYPATTADGGFANFYAGTAPMGSVFAIPKELDLAAMWTDVRTNFPTRDFAAYEILAIMYAFQQYGGMLVDTAFLANNTIVVENTVPDAQFQSFEGAARVATAFLCHVANYSPTGGGSPTGGNLMAPLAAPLQPLH